MTNKDFKANSTAVVITVISLFLLVVSSLYVLFSRVSEQEIASMEQTAQKLVEANFDTVSYFKLSSLPALEGYEFAAYPEGIIPCDTSVFSNYGALTDFINDTFSPTTAALLLNIEINEKKRYFDYNGQLCMTKTEPVLTYDKDWTNLTLRLTAVKRKSADINVTVHVKNSTETAVIKLHMEQLKDGWRLDEIAY